MKAQIDLIDVPKRELRALPCLYALGQPLARTDRAACAATCPSLKDGLCRESTRTRGPAVCPLSGYVMNHPARREDGAQNHLRSLPDRIRPIDLISMSPRAPQPSEAIPDAPRRPRRTRRASSPPPGPANPTIPHPSQPGASARLDDLNESLIRNRASRRPWPGQEWIALWRLRIPEEPPRLPGRTRRSVMLSTSLLLRNVQRAIQQLSVRGGIAARMVGTSVADSEPWLRIGDRAAPIPHGWRYLYQPEMNEHIRALYILNRREQQEQDATWRWP